MPVQITDPDPRVARAAETYLGVLLARREKDARRLNSIFGRSGGAKEADAAMVLALRALAEEIESGSS